MKTHFAARFVHPQSISRAISLAAATATCLLLPYLLLRENGSTLPAILLAYGLFFAGVLIVFAIAACGRQNESIAVQLTLLPILCLALTIRLIAAHTPGHGFDLPIVRGWAMSAAQLGLAHSYVEQLNGNVLPNYPPLIITWYWIAGLLYKLVISGTFDTLLPSWNIVIRFPAIVADVLVCAMLGRVVRAAGMQRTWALAALLYAIHPVSLYDTSVWGQTDSIYALWMLLATHAVAQQRWASVGVWSAFGLLTKPQAAAILPVVFMITFRHIRSYVPFVVGAAAAAAALLAPFIYGGVLGEVLAIYRHAVGGYLDTISIGAYNFWTIFHRTAEQSDTELAFGLVSFRSIGLFLFGAATLLVLFRLRGPLFSPRTSREHLLAALLSGALTTSAMFIFATEMHERYQFAYIVLALPIAMFSIPGAVLYVVTSLLILVNLVGEMALLMLLNLVGQLDTALYRMLHVLLSKVISVMQVIVFFVSLQMAPQLVGVERRAPS